VGKIYRETDDLAEFTLGADDGQDHYDVSLVDGKSQNKMGFMSGKSADP
jgi:hypothetical protein